MTTRLRVLAAAGVVDRRHAPLERPPRRVVGRSCCRAAYLRGAFLGAGSLSLGRSPHLELRAASLESAALLARLAHAEGVELAIAERATHAVAYAKSWEAIESLLALMGAAETVLALEERAVVAETRGVRTASRTPTTRISCARAALRGASSPPSSGCVPTASSTRFPDRLREAAELRLRHPTESLRELAARADPPATKAALHRRLRVLEELAEERG